MVAIVTEDIKLAGCTQSIDVSSSVCTFYVICLFKKTKQTNTRVKTKAVTQACVLAHSFELPNITTSVHDFWLEGR